MGVSAGGMLACYGRKGLWLEVHAGGNPENGEGPQDLAGMACGCMRQQKGGGHHGWCAYLFFWETVPVLEWGCLLEGT